MDEYEEISEQETLERLRDELEHTMINLPAETKPQHKIYISGIIDGWFDIGAISEEIRGILYLEYGVG